MKQNQSNWKRMNRDKMIIILSIIGLIACIAVLFPQVRELILGFAEQMIHKKANPYQSWFDLLRSLAMGGIFFIVSFDYCTLTDSGRTLVQTVKQEITDCLSEVNFQSFLKPIALLSVIYFLGILTIIRANFSYVDDLRHAIDTYYRGWSVWSRYVTELGSIFVHGDILLTDISPLPQLLAVLVLSVSSVLLVYVLGNKKLTAVQLLASIPLGLSPYFLECLVFKFDAPYMALSILACIVPFLFIRHKKAFLFCSIVSLLIMCTTYQAASGMYPMIVTVICFQEWNSGKKPLKDIMSFFVTAGIAFCIAMLFFRFFLMKSVDDWYATTSIHPVSYMIQGTLNNIKSYAMDINHDFGRIWKIGIGLVLLFFITRSIHISRHNKLLSSCVSITVIGLLFVLSFGLYTLLSTPLFRPRALIGFGLFLSILCIYVASETKKSAALAVLALNWCFFIFAFSYGNALADQARYAEFRISLLLHDLSALYPDPTKENITFQLKESIDYTPAVKNIAKHYPVIERLVPKRLGAKSIWDDYYFREYFNFYKQDKKAIAGIDDPGNTGIDSDTLNMPVVSDSYYHTIQSDGSHVLIILKH